MKNEDPRNDLTKIRPLNLHENDKLNQTYNSEIAQNQDGSNSNAEIQRMPSNLSQRVAQQLR